MKLTVVLGAGFSLAASGMFPITDKLGDLVMEHLHTTGKLAASPRAYQGRRFEAWLSRLAEPQPDLSEADNLHNQEMFVRVSSAIRDVIAECQSCAIESPPEWWLQRFVGCLHYAKSTAITFNYDTLIELVLENNWMTDEKFNQAHAVDALRHMPLLAERPQTGFTIGHSAASTMRLIKLHGSIDTYWVNGDGTGATIRRWDNNVRWNQQVSAFDEIRKNILPGREPFIVPPASAKSAFYRNPLTRQLWADAAEAVRDADEVAFIGYSLPATDFVSLGMFGERLNENEANVVIVNPAPNPPRDALQELGLPKSRLSFISNCADYVDVLERRCEPNLSYPDTSDFPIAIGAQNFPQFPILKVEPGLEDGEVLVHAGERQSSITVQPGASVVNDLSKAGSGVKRIRVLFPDGNFAYIAKTVIGTGTSGTPETLILRPTAIPHGL